MLCAVRVICVSVIVRAVHQSSSKLGDTPLARLDLFESLPSQRFGCRASTTNSTAKSRSTSLYICIALSRAGCRALQLYSAPERSTSLQLYRSALYTLHPLHPPSDQSKPRRVCVRTEEILAHSSLSEKPSEFSVYLLLPDEQFYKQKDNR